MSTSIWSLTIQAPPVFSPGLRTHTDPVWMTCPPGSALVNIGFVCPLVSGVRCPLVRASRFLKHPPEFRRPTDRLGIEESSYPTPRPPVSTMSAFFSSRDDPPCLFVYHHGPCTFSSVSPHQFPATEQVGLESPVIMWYHGDGVRWRGCLTSRQSRTVKTDMMKTYPGLLLFTVALLLWAPRPFACFPDTVWTRTYGGDHSDAAYSIWPTANGGYVIAGFTKSFGAGREDVYLIKVDGTGGLVWAGTYGGPGQDIGKSVQQTADGGYIITGQTESFGAGDFDVYLIRTDENGDTLWTRTYGGPVNDMGQCVQQTLDGGFIAAGYTESFSVGISDVYLIKTKANGDTLWTRTYGGALSEEALSIQQTSDGGYVVAGFTSSFGAGSYDAYLLKTDQNGDTLWARTYGGESSDRAYAVEQTSDGGYILVGYTGSFGVQGHDLYMIKTDQDGDTLWTREYGGSGYDYGWSVRQTPDGGYVVTGFTDSFGQGSYDVWVLRTEQNGDTLWTRTFGGAQYDQGSSILQTSDRGYIVAGFTQSFGSGGFDFYLLKMAPDDASIWNGSLGEAIISVSPVIPNPSRGEALIEYHLAQSMAVTIAVYNALGQRVAILAERRQNEGVHIVVWDGRDYLGRKVCSGLYVLRFETEGYGVTRKLLVVE